MIQCKINSMPAVPKQADKIKITRANSRLKASDSFTYDITFPMDILENRLVFGNIHRADVSKRIAGEWVCELIVDNVQVINGKGLLTHITDSEVKLQVVCENANASNVKVNDYIDTLDDYPQVQWTETGCMVSSGNYGTDCPVYSAADGIVLNQPKFLCEPTMRTGYVNPVSQSWTEYHDNVAFQPRLQAVLAAVMKHIGYELNTALAGVAQSPWYYLYIVNSRVGTYQFKQALPHWTVAKFIDEFEKLFNITFVYGTWNHLIEGTNRYAVAVPKGKENQLTFDGTNWALSDEEGASKTAAYEMLDEYSVDYDEDGLKLSTEENIKYNMSSSHEGTEDYIPPSAYLKFETLFYSHENDIYNMMVGGEQTLRYKLTHIFKTPFGVYFIRHTTDGLSLVKSNIFSPIIRDEEGNDVELNLVPCSVASVELQVAASYPTYDSTIPEDWAGRQEENNDPWFKQQIFSYQIAIPSTAEVDDNNIAFDTVADYVDGNLASETDEDIVMEMFFLDPQPDVQATYEIVAQDCTFWHRDEETDSYYTVDFTMRHQFRLLLGSPASFFGSLELNPGVFNPYIGQFQYSRQTVDIHNKTVIKFLASDLPSADHIYIFNNKRYFCEKIEMEIADGRVDPVKTGYFYEID